MKLFLSICLIMGIFSLLPVVYGPSVCPEDTSEENECVFYGTDILMFPIESSEEFTPHEEMIDSETIEELIEIDSENMQEINDSIQQKNQNDYRNATMIKRDNIWFKEIIEKHEKLMQEINERLFGNVTNSEFGFNGNPPTDYVGTHISRSEDKELQESIINEMKEAKSKFCEKFGKFINFVNDDVQNKTEITNLSINDVEMEFGEYPNSDICVEEMDYKITISSKDPKIMELTELIKTWIEKNNE